MKKARFNLTLFMASKIFGEMFIKQVLYKSKIKSLEFLILWAREDLNFLKKEWLAFIQVMFGGISL